MKRIISAKISEDIVIDADIIELAIEKYICHKYGVWFSYSISEQANHYIDGLLNDIEKNYSQIKDWGLFCRMWEQLEDWQIPDVLGYPNDIYVEHGLEVFYALIKRGEIEHD